MLKLIGPINSGAAVGADGAATITAYSTKIVSGLVHGVYVKYNGDKPATGDVTISTKGTSPAVPSTAILTLTDANTDGLFLPRIVSHSAAGVANALVENKIPVHDIIKIVLAQSNTDDTVDVWLMVEE